MRLVSDMSKVLRTDNPAFNQYRFEEIVRTGKVPGSIGPRPSAKQ